MMKSNIEKRLEVLERWKATGTGRCIRVTASGHSHGEVVEAIRGAGGHVRDEDRIIVRDIVGADGLAVARLRAAPPVVRTI
jgi:hypothetical protein